MKYRKLAYVGSSVVVIVANPQIFIYDMSLYLSIYLSIFTPMFMIWLSIYLQHALKCIYQYSFNPQKIGSFLREALV
jgi:hypothetical protein